MQNGFHIFGYILEKTSNIVELLVRSSLLRLETVFIEVTLSRHLDIVGKTMDSCMACSDSFLNIGDLNLESTKIPLSDIRR